MFLESNSKNFDKFAEDVVASFISGSTPLDDAIVKLANENALLPEEVKRVVEKSNTLATIQLIKVAQDGELTFTLADASKILKQTHPENMPAVPAIPASDAQASLGEMINTLKTAADADAYFKSFAKPREKTAGDKASKLALREVFSLKKKMEELGRQKVACELQFKKSADKLLSDFSGLYSPDFQKFACEAYTMCGASSKPLLEALASDIKEPLSLEKVAYCVDDVSDKQLVLFKQAHESISKVCSLSEELVITRTKLAKAWDDVKKEGR
jgi:hypothetical protein